MTAHTAQAGWGVPEWGALVGISRRTVYDLIGNNTLKSVTIGRRRIIIESPVDFLARMAKEAA